MRPRGWKSCLAHVSLTAQEFLPTFLPRLPLQACAFSFHTISAGLVPGEPDSPLLHLSALRTPEAGEWLSRVVWCHNVPNAPCGCWLGEGAEVALAVSHDREAANTEAGTWAS